LFVGLLLFNAVFKSLLVISRRHGTQPAFVVFAQIYKRYVAFIKVCRGTKQRQRHRETGITMIFFTAVKNIDEQWSISLSHIKA